MGAVGRRRSKTIDNHIHALSLSFVWYDFCQTHKAHKLSSAIAAGRNKWGAEV